MTSLFKYVGVTGSDKGEPVSSKAVETSKIVNSVDDADHIGSLQVLLSPAPILLSTASINEDCVHPVRRDLGWDTDLW